MSCFDVTGYGVYRAARETRRVPAERRDITVTHFVGTSLAGRDASTAAYNSNSRTAWAQAVYAQAALYEELAAVEPSLTAPCESPTAAPSRSP
ncbi:hypothetical protein [Embleya sp. NPDC001921]